MDFEVNFMLAYVFHLSYQSLSIRILAGVFEDRRLSLALFSIAYRVQTARVEYTEAVS